MHLKNTLNLNRGSFNVGLYSVVFLSKASFFVVLFLFLSFLIQPIHQAMANEAVAEEEQTEEVETLEITTPADTVFDEAEENPQPEEFSVGNSTETEEIMETEENTEEAIDVEITQDAATNSGSEEDLNSEVTSSGEENGGNLGSDSSNETTTSTDETIVDNASATSGTTGEEASDNEIATSSNDVTETTTTSTPDDETATTSPDSETSATSSDDETATSSNEVTETATSTPDDETATTSPDSETSATSSDEETTNSSEETDGSATDDSYSDTEEESTDDSSINNDSDSAETSSSEEEDNMSDEIIEGGVSDIVNEVVDLTRQLVTEENYYQFSRQSCVPVGDGTFHCTTKKDLPVDLDSAVFSEQDDEGDMEIYLRTSEGDIKQLTDNEFDDTSPDVDHSSMKVVWQRLIDGRYQIISYDLSNQEETQLTFSRTNSMEPRISKDGIVWQAWDGEDWEIVFFNGQYTNIITNNQTQDVTPVIEDGYILWSILGGEEQEAKVYSIESGETMTIADHEGGTVANPRFVLVYDTKFENGDVVTQGFDPETGLSSPISAKPAELPFDIPKNDPIGEVRALIQNKSSQKDKDIVTISNDNPNGTPLDVSSTSVSSSSLILPDTTDNSFDIDQATNTSQTNLDFELSEYDLVITPTATSTSLDDISDELPTITERATSSTQE